MLLRRCRGSPTCHILPRFRHFASAISEYDLDLQRLLETREQLVRPSRSIETSSGDLEVDAENILQTPISLGLPLPQRLALVIQYCGAFSYFFDTMHRSTSIQEVEEGFRFLHLIPRQGLQF